RLRLRLRHRRHRCGGAGGVGGPYRHHHGLQPVRIPAVFGVPYCLPAPHGRTAPKPKGRIMSNGTHVDPESQITLTRTIDANVSDVVSAWTDPALIEQWQADEVELDGFEGGEYRFT